VRSDTTGREGRRHLTSDDRRRLVDMLVVFERLDHEQGEVHAPDDCPLDDLAVGQRGAGPATPGFPLQRELACRVS
jgi:hypothetical protein